MFHGMMADIITKKAKETYRFIISMDSRHYEVVAAIFQVA